MKLSSTYQIIQAGTDGCPDHERTVPAASIDEAVFRIMREGVYGPVIGVAYVDYAAGTIEDVSDDVAVLVYGQIEDMGLDAPTTAREFVEHSHPENIILNAGGVWVRVTERRAA